MTIREAINLLKSMKDYYNDEDRADYMGYDDEENEAVNMAIDALEQKNKKAKWEYDNKTVVCSNCQTWFNISDRFVFMRYCPYCGLKMKSGVIKCIYQL